LESFPGLEHRLEFIREKNGVRYYNDSKGTNVGAVVKSLASFTEPVILLAGGVDKGGDYAPLEAGIKQKVRRLVLFGAAKNVIARALGAFTETVIVEDMHAAVRDAAAHARAGDVVLLSPACSSFDQFRNYAARGKVFKTLVQQL
jgi:UDP-N-acetylmuramoylalanine--D-glutamate ligase